MSIFRKLLVALIVKVGTFFIIFPIYIYIYIFFFKRNIIPPIVRTWRPIGGIRTQMRDYFLGSSVRLKDPAFVEVPKKTSAPTTLNRFGVRSETSGSLRFRCHVAVTDPRLIRKTVESDDLIAKPGQIRRTVEDILQNYKGSSGLRGSLQSLAASTSTLGGGAFFGSSSMQGSLTASRNFDGTPLGGGAGRSDRVAEILARARSKVANGTKSISSALSLAGGGGGGASSSSLSSSSSSAESKAVAATSFLDSAKQSFGFSRVGESKQQTPQDAEARVPLLGADSKPTLSPLAPRGAGGGASSTDSKAVAAALGPVSRGGGGGRARYSDSEDENDRLISANR